MCVAEFSFFSTKMDKKEYKCKFCHKVFSYPKNRNRHEKVGIYIYFFLSGEIY